MPGAELQAGRAFVDIVPTLNKGAAAATQAQLGGAFAGLTGKAKAAGLVVGAGLAAGVAVGAAGLLKAGNSITAAFDTIRLGTGATGEAMEGLKDSFRNVAKTVPSSLGDVGTAIADLNTRTGQTGGDLERLSTQMLNLSRIADEDLAGTIKSQTRLFGDWGVEIEDQATTLDTLWKTSQATGIGINELSDKLVRFGAPLRQLGFGLEDSSALLGAFEREGVNADLVMGSLRIALGKMAREGEPAEETLARVTDQIKEAGSTSEANALALELFGARAGPDMAAAIREGRFEVDELISSIKASPETVNGAAEATERFGEKFSKLKNRVTIALEPLAVGMVDALEDLIDAAGPVVTALGDKLPAAFAAIEEAAAPVVGAIRQIVGILFQGDFKGGGPFAEDSEFVDALFNLRELFQDKIQPVVEDFFDFLSKNAKPILTGIAAAFAILFAPLLTLGAALVAAYFKFEGFRKVVDAVVRFLVTTVAPAVARFASYVAEQFGNLVAWVQEHWAAIQEAIGHVVNVIRGIVEAFVDVISFVWENFGDTISAVVVGAFENVRAVIEFAFDLIAGLFEVGLAIINGDWSEAWEAFTGILSSAWDTVTTIVGNALSAVGALLRDGFAIAVELAKGALDGIVTFFEELPGKLADAAGDVFGFLWEAFRSAVNLIIDGWNSLEFKIPGFDPPGPGPTFGGFTLGVPDIPRLADGGDILRSGMAIVGEGQVGGELLSLPQGATATPLDTVAMIADAALRGAGEGTGGPGVQIGKLEVVNPVDATADETVDAINAKLGWKMTTRNDR